MVYILIDPTYAQSVWCDNLKHSLISELKKKRISFVISENCHSIPSDNIVFIIASDHTWTKNILQIFNHKTIQPILICNQISSLEGLNYSCVCSDVYGTVKNLFFLLKKYQKKSPAIYGINPRSLSDLSLQKCAENLSCEAGLTPKFFYNQGSLSECFEDFYSLVGDIDCVICVNDFAAISLIKHLEGRNSALLKKLHIFSCAKSEISKLYPQILSLHINYEDYGKAAVYISEKLKKHPYISNITLRITRHTEESIAFTTELPSIRYSEELSVTDHFYQDSEILEMICFEKLLCNCDKIDFAIIEMLQKKATYHEICEKCFLSESSVSYRISQILKLCGFRSKEELLAIVAKYYQAK